MATLTLRALTRPGDTTKNAPLTNAEVDTNFINLDEDISQINSRIDGLPSEFQEPLVSGANIKTIKGNSLLGSGDLNIGGINFRYINAAVTLADAEGVLADSSAGSFTVTLPATPTEGFQCFINDGGDWGANPVTVARNGSTIEGLADNLVLDIAKASVQFIYSGNTWRIFMQVGANPAGWFWSDISGKPSTVDGYGILDAAKKATTLAGYGITDGVSKGVGAARDSSALMANAPIGQWVAYSSATGAGADWPSATTVSWWNVFTFGTSSRATQLAHQVLANGTLGLFLRSKHDSTWSEWFHIGGRELVSVVSTNISAKSTNTYVLTAAATITLPASPYAGDWIAVSNCSGVATCVIARNGSKIMGLDQDMTLDANKTNFRLIYADSSLGWVLAV